MPQLPSTLRTKLETKQRHQLIEHATNLGINNANKLTQLELIDEILIASINNQHELQNARGLLGRARDLVSNVVEKGLHLPNQQPQTPPPQEPQPPHPNTIPTIALANVYANQGLTTHATNILNTILNNDPNNAAAISLKANIQTRTKTPPRTPIPTTPPLNFPTKNELRINRNNHQLHITWMIKPTTFAHFKSLAPQGSLNLRIAHSIHNHLNHHTLHQDIPITRLASSTQTTIPTNTIYSHAAIGWLNCSLFQVIITAQPQNPSPH